MHKLITQLLTLFLLSLLFGCLEHRFFINVLPENNISLTYLGQGDRLDWDDDGQLLPDSIRWQLKRRIQGRKQTIHIIEGAIDSVTHDNLNRVLNWQKVASDSLHISHDFSISSTKSYFGKSWHFRGKLFSRRFTELYGDIWDFVPEECQVLDDEEALEVLSNEEIEQLEEKFGIGVLQWNMQRYIKKFYRTWSLSRLRYPELPDTGSTDFSIALAGWQEDLHLYLNSLNVTSPKTVNLDWWSDVKPLFVGRIYDICGPDRIRIVQEIAESLEREYQISKDIEDDVYIYSISLPGRRYKGNGDKDDEGVYGWEFTGNYLLNSDGLMSADSFEISIWKTGITAFAFILFINLLRRLIRKRHNV